MKTLVCKVMLLSILCQSLATPAMAAGPRYRNRPSQNAAFVRAKFAACSLALGAGAYTGLPRVYEALERNKDALNAILNENDPKTAYLRTIVEAQMMLIGKLILAGVGGTIGIKMGNAGARDTLKNMSIQQYFLLSVIVAPVIEELLFREAPGLITSNNWVAGSIAAALFALIHNKTDKGFDFSMIPATQFIGGIYYWYLMDHRGFSHSLVAHTTNNLMVLTAFAISRALSTQRRR